MNKSLLILLIFSLNAFSKEILLFENDSYRFYDEIESSCSHLYLYNKKDKNNLLLRDPFKNEVNLSEKNCFSKGNKESIKVTFFSSGEVDLSSNKKYLRVNYDLDSNILISNDDYQKIHYSKCAVVDIDNAVFISNGNARDELCSEDDFLSYVFPDIGLPISWDNLFNYVLNNKFTDVIEYEVNNYISVLLSIDYEVSKINHAIKILREYGYINQSDMLYKSKYAKVRDKTYLYSDDFVKSSMYLISGDKVFIIKDALDGYGGKWYFINYKGKKEINMWIKADAIVLN